MKSNTYMYKQAIRLIKEGVYRLTKDGLLFNVRLSRQVGSIGSHGYWQATLWCNKKKERYVILIHRLVYCYFKGMVGPEIEIDHHDNDRSNPKLSNLQALTHQGNIDKMNKLGRQRSARGANHTSAKLSDKQALVMRYLWIFGYKVDCLCKIFKVKHYTVRRILKGVRYIYDKRMSNLTNWKIREA